MCNCVVYNVLKTAALLCIVLLAFLWVFVVRCLAASYSYTAAHDGDMNIRNVLESSEFNDWGEWDYWAWGLVSVAVLGGGLFCLLTTYYAAQYVLSRGTWWLCCSRDCHPNGHCDGALCALCCARNPDTHDVGAPLHIVTNEEARSCIASFPPTQPNE